MGGGLVRSRMLRFSTTKEEFNESHGFWQDNPSMWQTNEKHLQSWMASNRRTPTAGFPSLMLDPKKLVMLPGEMNEHRFDRPADDTWTEEDFDGRDWFQEEVNKVTDSMKDVGWNEKNPSGKIFVVVEYDGKAYISEGNKRTRAAVTAGIEKVPVSVRYFGGSEMLPDAWHPMEAL